MVFHLPVFDKKKIHHGVCEAVYEMERQLRKLLYSSNVEGEELEVAEDFPRFPGSPAMELAGQMM